VEELFNRSIHRTVMTQALNSWHALVLLAACLMAPFSVNAGSLSVTSPPIFTVAPGASQILRIALRRAPDAARERSYRIFVTEVPGKPQPDFTGTQFALKISLPIFVDASGAKTSPQVEWSGARTDKGELALTAANTGAKHIQVQAVEVMKEGSDPDARFAGPWYILPGQRRTATIRPSDGHTIPADRIRIKAETDAGPLAADVVLEKR